MLINANTKIGSILRERAEALDAIISISPKFEKLRNPILRKLMATRTSIAAASKLGNCQVSDFFNKLRPLGFEIDERILGELYERKSLPDFMMKLGKGRLTELDVRPIIAAGKDPLHLIIQKTRLMKPGQGLKIINTFYPEPLILLLKKQGFESYVDVIDDNLVETYFYKKDISIVPINGKSIEATANWSDLLLRYKNKIQFIDVRRMPMPMPMMAILDVLDKLPGDMALYVYHKRIPVYLLPELRDRAFSFCSREISEGEVHFLIFKT